MRQQCHRSVLEDMLGLATLLLREEDRFLAMALDPNRYLMDYSLGCP
jgi:hypothetical protein